MDRAMVLAGRGLKMAALVLGLGLGLRSAEHAVPCAVPSPHAALLCSADTQEQMFALSGRIVDSSHVPSWRPSTGLHASTRSAM